MATISTAIQLHDRVTAPINNIISAIENVCNAFDSVESSMDGGFDARAIDSARAALNEAVLEADNLGREIDENARKQDKFTDEIEESASEMDGLGKLAAGVGIFFGLSELKNQVSTAIDYASDLQEVQNVVDVAFGSASKTIDEWAMNTLESFGINELSAKRYAGTMGAMLKSSGLAGDEVADMSMKISELAGDMASFYNLEGEDAFNKLRSGISGETEPLKQLGINMSVANLEAYAMSQGIETSFNKMSQAEQVMLRYNYLLQATTDAQGDFARTSDSFSNQTKLLAENWRAFTGEIAEGVLPILSKGIGVLNKSIQFLSDNLSIILPIIAGLTAVLAIYLIVTKGVELATKLWAAAQAFFNGVMALNPIFLIIMAVILLISLIYAIVGAINKVTGKSISATGVIAGAVLTAVAYVWNLFLGFLDFILGIINAIVNPWIAWANFFGNLFNDPIGSVIHLFGDFADRILGIVESIAKALDKVFGSNLAESVQGWRSGLNSMVETAANKYGNGSYEKIADSLNLSSESLGLKRWEYGDAYKTGYEWGANLGKKSAEEDALEDVLNNAESVNEIAENTDEMAGALSDTADELKYLRDIAEREIINRFTTAEIKIEQTNNNNISSDMDIDGIMDKWNSDFEEILVTAAEGVHA